MNKTIFNNNDYTINKETEAHLTDNDVRQNLKTIHSIIVQTHLNNRPPNNKLLNRPPPEIDKTEETLPHSTRRRLSQLRADKSSTHELPTQDKQRRLPLSNLPTL